MSAAANTSQAVWRARLCSALRTVLACAIVDCTTLYGPEHIRRLLAFPAYAYVTAILIVSDATLGDALRGCWQVLYASVQVMLPSVLSLWVIGPRNFTPAIAALAVALSAFAVALPDSTPLMAKRIAFGQTVNVYVSAVILGPQTGAVMLPVQVVSSTALGALASVLAMLLPYPHLAFLEVRKTCRLYVENASERLDLLVKAFSAQDKMAATDLLAEEKTFSERGAKLLERVKGKQQGMLWERPQLRFLKPHLQDPGEKLQDLEIPIKGMELALNSCTSFPVGMMEELLRDFIKNSKVKIGIKLEQAKCSAAFFQAPTAPETQTNEESTDRTFWIHETTFITHEDLSALFFFYCMTLLQDGSPVSRFPDDDLSNSEEQGNSTGFKMLWGTIGLTSERIVFALKCSLSLGLAVLFGLFYNKQNAYWAGITIATSFVTGRKATFSAANARAQGTAMGSVYGILCCFIFQKFVSLRFLPLLPWIIFTSFLRHSRMYGQAGSISAVIGALLILGRENYGPPSEFAIARIAEATIGLICLIILEVLLHPARAATLAKTELSRTLRALQECIEGMILGTNEKEMAGSLSRKLRQKQKQLKSHVIELEAFIAEAEIEPDFWFLPFHGDCYHELLRSLSKMGDLLLFAACKIEFLLRVSARLGVAWKELEQQLNDDLDFFAEKVGSSLKCLDEVLMMKSLPLLEKELQNKSASPDIELGKSQNADVSSGLGPDNEDIEQMVSSFFQYSTEVVNKIHGDEAEEQLRGQTVLCLSGLGFCIESLMRETMEIEKKLVELVKWENPEKNINLHEILCKLQALHKINPAS